MGGRRCGPCATDYASNRSQPVNMTTPLTQIDLKLLRIFNAASRHQGFARAQQELNLTVSAISSYMSQLEAKIGFKVCRRGRGGFALTPKGKLLLDKAVRLLGELDNFESYAADLKGEISGSLKIGIVDSTVTDPALKLSEAIGALSEKHAAVHLSLCVRGPYELQRGLLENELDFVIGWFPSKANGVTYHPLYQEQQWLYCGDRHPSFGKKDISETEASNLRIARRTYWSRADVERYGAKNSVATVESIEAQLFLILSGGYVGYLPDHYAKDRLERGQLRMILPSKYGFRTQISLATRRERIRERLIMMMRALLQG